jgi:hypothetical protein
LISKLTGWYDGEILTPRRAGNTGLSREIPCAISLLCGVQPWFLERYHEVVQGWLLGGFLARFLVVRANPTGKRVARPHGVKEIRERQIQHLRELYTDLKSQPPSPSVQSKWTDQSSLAYDRWYESAPERRSAHALKEFADRIEKATVVKLALCVQFMTDGTTTIKSRAMEYAIDLGQWVIDEQTPWFNSISPIAVRASRVLDYLDAHGPTGKTVLVKKCLPQGLRKWERDEVFSHLLERGDVSVDKERTGDRGAPPFVYRLVRRGRG